MRWLEAISHYRGTHTAAPNFAYDLCVKRAKPEQIAAGITWIARDHVVKNNIFSNGNEGKLFDASNCNTDEPSNLMIAASNYNAYYRTLSTKPRNVIRWSLGTPDQCAVLYRTLAAFQSATGYEASSLAIDNVATNPFFVDETNEDFHLKSGSPAIGRGEALPPEVANALGLPSGVKVDLGALQATQY